MTTNEGERRVLPMFPLGSVLLPTSLLPLHVFEERYRQLVRDVLAGSQEFGVALIERGWEVGGGDERSGVGCVAQLLDSEELPDGRWHVVAVGTRRFRVVSWLDDDPYPRAEIEMLDEPVAETADATAYQAVVRDLKRVLGLRAELGAPVVDIPALAEDPALGAWQVAALAPLGPYDRQQLLVEPVVSDRLMRLGQLLSDCEDDLQTQLRLG